MTSVLQSLYSRMWAAPTPKTSVSSAGSGSSKPRTPGISTHLETKFMIHDIPHQAALEGRGRTFEEVLHPQVGCDGPHCAKLLDGPGIKVLWGNRFCCLDCKYVNFCSRCIQDDSNNHTPWHVFVRCIFPVREGRVYREDEEAWETVLTKCPSLKNVTLSHVVVFWTIEEWVPNSIRQSLGECRQTTFGARFGSRSQKQEPRFVGLGPDGSTVPSSQQISDIKRHLRQQGIQHYSVAETIDHCTGKIRPYSYAARLDFYGLMRQARNATRVVDIQPGNLDDKVFFELRAVELRDEKSWPEYETLSYTSEETTFVRGMRAALGQEEFEKDTSSASWNVAQMKHAIYCGKEYMAVSQSLFDAIQRLRDPIQVRTFWIDQLCINQSLEDEKNYQVRNMGAIYHRGVRSTVWVGEQDDDSQRAIKIIRTFAAILEKDPQLVHDNRFLVARSEGRLPLWGSPDWVSLANFFFRPIYGCIWVFQELILARDVTFLCGDEAITWAELNYTLQVMLEHASDELFDKAGASGAGSKSRSNIESLAKVNVIRAQWDARMPLGLERLLYLTSKLQVTNPRDKVYALLGVRVVDGWAFTDSLLPEHSQSIGQTFIDAAKLIMTTESSLSLLGLNSTVSEKKTPGIPSWCPDLTVTHLAADFALNRPEPPIPYQAHGDSAVVVAWPYEARPDLLVTSSIKVDTVRCVGLQGFEPDVRDGEVLAEWVNITDACGELYRTGEDTAEAFFRTIVANATFPMKREPLSLDQVGQIAHYVAAKANDQNMSVQSGPVKTSSLTEWPGKNATMGSMLATSTAESTVTNASLGKPTLAGPPDTRRAIIATCAHRRFFRTGGLLLGVGARDVKPGDEVHILSGGKVPVILRPKHFPRPDQPEDFDVSIPSYSLIGETYLHGIMNGELARGKDVAWSRICIH